MPSKRFFLDYHQLRALVGADKNFATKTQAQKVLHNVLDQVGTVFPYEQVELVVTDKRKQK